MKKLLLLLTISLTMSCNDSKYAEAIVGEWECVSWIDTASSKEKCNNNAYFSFKKDMTYTSKVGAQETNGIYKIVDGVLYSTPKDKLEIAVEINTLNADTLSFTMSRSGNEEILTLIKKK
ncbi:Lipocalin-like domain-containing protein [Formosa sp. Hel1_31_208]|uniref:lipocalin family protein n=1 Tax=Formosa sp. Hel1_31_208 TaxID=1798225 RepID=UPI000879DF50|nr:lipocalin family protein [Formosa sp. Hel1_31_208]SDS13516.1 Lipocalin-like domain-containing protein [Formosa sp. Hel1_31_208]